MNNPSLDFRKLPLAEVETGRKAGYGRTAEWNAVMTNEILGYIVAGLLAAFMIWGLVIDTLISNAKIRKRNREYIEENNLHERRKMLCLDCKYCQIYKHHAFYKYGPLGNAFVTKHPEYCRRFKEPLHLNRNSRCITLLAEQTMWESEPAEVKTRGK